MRPSASDSSPSAPAERPTTGSRTPLPTSEVRNDDDFGVFKLTLHASTYDWVFLPIAGSTFTDSGTGTVHGAPATVPGAPTIGTATAGNAQATVTWTAPASNGGSAITGYVVTPYIGTTAQSSTTVGNVTSTLISRAHATAPLHLPGRGHQRDRHRRPVGRRRTRSRRSPPPPSRVRPRSGPPPPATPQATVTWSAPASNGGSPITGYVVTPYIGDHRADARPSSATSPRRSSPRSRNGTSYTFRVAAINAIGTGNQSADSNAVTPVAPATVPGAPTIGTATAGNAQATVTWSAPASNGGSAITGYVVTPYIGTTAQSSTTVGNVTSTLISPLSQRHPLHVPGRCDQRDRHRQPSRPTRTRSRRSPPATVPGAPDDRNRHRRQRARRP